MTKPIQPDEVVAFSATQPDREVVLSDELEDCAPFQPLTPEQKLDLFKRGIVAPQISDEG